MKRFIAKLSLAVFGLLAVFGTYAKDAKALIHSDARTQKIQNVSESTPLYLMHAKDLFSSSEDLLAWHYSHSSHQSHWSHQSHQSHYSHYSGR